jgi:hypothetical protein
MWTLIYIISYLVINFYTTYISENKKLIKNNYRKNERIKGFPYQYFKEEVLTNEVVKFRIGLIYIYFMIFITVSFSVGPTIGPIIEQTTFISTTTSTKTN